MNETCPHCGAPLLKQSFVVYCPYCGYYSSLDKKSEPTQLVPRKEACDVFNYLQKNQPYINKCLITVQSFPTHFLLTSNGFFAPRKGMVCHPSLRFQFHAYCSADKYDLSLVSNHDEYDNPFLFLRLDNKTVLNTKPLFLEGTWKFSLNIEELALICQAKSIECDCSISGDYNDFGELILFSQRFYNAFVDKSRYAFSQNRYILCDSI